MASGAKSHNDWKGWAVFLVPKSGPVYVVPVRIFLVPPNSMVRYIHYHCHDDFKCLSAVVRRIHWDVVHHTVWCPCYFEGMCGFKYSFHWFLYWNFLIFDWHLSGCPSTIAGRKCKDRSLTGLCSQFLTLEDNPTATTQKCINYHFVYVKRCNQHKYESVHHIGKFLWWRSSQDRFWKLSLDKQLPHHCAITGHMIIL